MKSTRRGSFYVVAGLVIAVVCAAWGTVSLLTPKKIVAVEIPVQYADGQLPQSATASTAGPAEQARDAQQVDGTTATKAELIELARRDPLVLARVARERFQREVKDYQCLLIKQERVKGELSAVQEVDLLVRHSPQTVYMKWVKNEDQARRVLYRDDPGFRDADGMPMARVEPAGAVVRLFVTDIMMPIRGPHAKNVSRRAIDECGFGATFDLLERYNDQARAEGVLKIRYGGEGVVDGRPTFVMIRELPFEEDGGRFPDAKMVLHLDQELLLPVCVESYADFEGKELLGKYVFTNVRLNPGLTDDDFKF